MKVRLCAQDCMTRETSALRIWDFGDYLLMENLTL